MGERQREREMMRLLRFGAVLPWPILGLGCWIGYQLVRQNGRVLVRLEALERQLAHLGTGHAAEPGHASGLPIGSVAPPFELPDLDGNRRSLEEFRGRRVQLIFFSPNCGFCVQMLPDLAVLARDGADGRPVPLVVSSGPAEMNRQLFEQHGIRDPVLLQKQTEVATAYQAWGTPIGYLIDEQGRIASEIAEGAQAVLALAGAPPLAAAGHDGHGAAAHGNGHRPFRSIRSSADSRINRDGLPAGTPTPDFRLPRPDGGEVSLEEFRGRRILLVLTDPDCGPCNALAPKLEQLSRTRPDLQLLMVSRGTPEANRKKMAEHGLTFPVVLQRHWEVSRLYGTFATPAGYLIDEAGTIAKEVAMGPDAILALASETAAPVGG
jgi:peroxiredoxin